MAFGGFQRATFPKSGKPIGRPPGSRTRKTRDRAITASLAGIAPIEVILTSMREAWEAGDRKLAAEMAEIALPYCSPRLASTDMTMKADNVHRVISDKPLTEEEWLAEHGEAANDAEPEAEPEPEADAV